MSLLLRFLIFTSICFRLKAMREPHINDFMQTRPSRDYSYQGPFMRDSHQHLNYRLMWKGLFPKSHEETVYQEIALGHTGRKEYIPLMNQREKHEERANGAIIAGVLLGKDKPLLGQPLKTYAKEQRIKSQEIQRRLEAIKATGHVDPELERQDIIKLFDANHKFNYKENPQASKKIDSNDRRMKSKQRKSAQRHEDSKQRKDTKSLDAKRRYSERRKVMKRVPK